TARGNPERESAWAKALLREIIERKKFSRVSDAQSINFTPPADPAHVEHRDDRTIFFLNTLRSGFSGVWYFARAEHAGRLHALPPRVEAMYQPEIHASGTETRLEVADGTLVRVPGRELENAVGVDGLLVVLPHITLSDADSILTMIPSKPRIGELLMAA